MKQYIKLILLIGILGGTFHAFAYINPYSGAIQLSELVLQLSGSRGEFPLGNSLTELLDFSMRMLPGYIFSAFVGTKLYRHFCTASVYVFSRYPHRLTWYSKEVMDVFVSVALFQAIQIGAAIATTIGRYQIIFDGAGIGLLVYHFAIHSLWLFLATLLINLLAIYIGSDSAYLSVIGGQVVLITLLIFVEEDASPFIRAANPISHLVIGWHGSENMLYSEVLRTAYQHLNLNSSLLYMIFISVLIMLIGGAIIKKHDLLISNSETEG